MRRPLAYVMSLVVFGAAVWVPSAVFSQVFPGNPVGGGGGGGGGASTGVVNNWTAQQNFSAGSATEPGIGWILDDDATGTGLYRRTSDVVSFTINGLGQGEINAAGIAFRSDRYYGWSSSSVGAAVDTQLLRHSAGVMRLGDATASSIRSLQGGGAAVASATALPLPTGRVFHVTGTTNVTSITSTNFEDGVCITIIFDGILTFTDGNNLRLAGNFVTTADDTISLCYDGTNWFETGRAIN